MLIQIGKCFNKMHQRYSNIDSETYDNYVDNVVCGHKIPVSSNDLHTFINAPI